MRKDREPPRLRSWKRCFDGEEEFDCENPTYGERIDLTEKQKNWLRRCWSWASMSMLNMDKAVVPSAVPCYNEKKGWHFVEAFELEWNHIFPIGEMKRFDGSDKYNSPYNVIPISAIQHTGRGLHPLDVDEVIYITHPDQVDVWGKYRDWKNNGKVGKDPFKHLFEVRNNYEKNHIPTHDRSYDEFFVGLAAEVVTAYRLAIPFDKWPIK